MGITETADQSSPIDRALEVWRKNLICPSLEQFLAAQHPLTFDSLDALAARVQTCREPCGKPCAALVTHLRDALQATQATVRAPLFDELPPTWIITRDGWILDQNEPARLIAARGQPVCVEEGYLIPAIPLGDRRFRQALAVLAAPGRFVWPTTSGSDAMLRLRPLPADVGIAASLLQESDPAADMAPRLARELSLPKRQSELGAHLLAGKSLTHAAQAM